MIEDAFEVATEFKFDVGTAMLNTKALTNAVDGLSQSANQALNSLNYLASGLVAHLGMGSGGLLAVLTKAVSLSEEFHVGTMGFVNSINSNFRFLDGTISNFNDQLGTSKMLMSNVRDQAGKLGIDPSQLAHMTQLFASPLAARHKLGTNYANGIELAKNTMIGAEATGMNPMFAGEMLARAMSPGQGIGGKLFERLVNTKTFQDAHIIHSPQLMGMNQDKKVDLLIKAMSELGNNAGYLSARLNSLRVQFNMFKAQIEKMLLPVGEALKNAGIKIFSIVSTYLAKNGEKFGKMIGQVVDALFADPQKLYLGIMQLRRLGHDFHQAVHFTEIFVTYRMLAKLLAMVGIELRGGLLITGLRYLWRGLTALVGVIPVARMFTWVLSQLGWALGNVFLPFLFFLGLFQGISKAIAAAHIEDLKTWTEVLPELAPIFVRLKAALSQIALPFTLFVDGIADLLTPVLSWHFWIQLLVPILNMFTYGLEMLGTTIQTLFAMISGIIAQFMGEYANLMQMKNPFSSLGEDFKMGFDDFMKRTSIDKDGKPKTAYQVTNVGKIEARFDMREQLEPDRIAFAVTDHLKRLAMNPQQGRGRSLRGAFGGAQAFATPTGG